MCTRAGRTTARGCLASAIILVVFAGCGPSPRSTAARETAPLAPIDAVPVDAPAVQPVNLLPNGSLEEIDETGRPRGWGVSPASLIVSTGRTEYDAFDGSRSLTLRSIGDAWGVAFAEVRIKPEDRGRSLFVTAQGRSPLNDFMRLSVEYAREGATEQIESSWPACPDSWHCAMLNVQLPPAIDDDTVRVRIIVRNEPGFVCRIDQVQAVFR